jgi:hypothetical protein
MLKSATQRWLIIAMLPGSLYIGINGPGVFGINEMRAIPGSTRQAVRFNDNIFLDGMIKLKNKI